MAGVIVTTHHALPKLPAAITLYTLQNTGLASHNGVAADFDHNRTALQIRQLSTWRK